MRLSVLISWCAISMAACVAVPTGPYPPSAPGAFVPDRVFSICRGGRPSNAPRTDLSNRIVDYQGYVVHRNQIQLAQVPLNGGCFNSGFGQRGRSLHKGIDISAPQNTPVYSGANGRIIEARWRNGYGYQIVISHGLGLYTRYAHLDRYADGVVEGASVGPGVLIGFVGVSGNARGPHLHYEVLTGTIPQGGSSIGLRGHDPLTFGDPPLPQS